MTGTLDPAVLRHVADLARLDLQDDERARLEADLASIVAYVGELARVPLPAAPSEPVPGPSRLRPDLPVEPAAASACACFPVSRDGLVPLPRVVDRDRDEP